MDSTLALLGGPKAVQRDPGSLFDWPIVTPELEAAVLAVLRAGAMSGWDITIQFEQEFAAWLGTPYALAHNSGTSALQAAFFSVGVGAGDEVICPSITYWASCLPVYSFGGTVVFADIDPVTLCIAPDDIEHRITPRTRAIVAVHYLGHPAEMEAILAIARRHGIAVVEDVSHAHGALYRGHMVGTFGDVAAFSLMTGKSLAIGEGGMLATSDRRIYERAIAFGHYERHASNLTEPDLVAGAGVAWGGVKHRMHQLSSAAGRVQLKHYPAQMAEIDRAMNYFWDLLEGVPGIRAHRPVAGSGTTMGGWYAAAGHYLPEELGGLSVTRFAQAVSAEGAACRPGCNRPLHLHPVFNTVDIYRHGRPTRLAHLPAGIDIRQPAGSLPVSEALQARVFGIPWFKHFQPALIEEYAAAYRKVVEYHQQLLVDDPGNAEDTGDWGLSRRFTLA